MLCLLWRNGESFGVSPEDILDIGQIPTGGAALHACRAPLVDPLDAIRAQGGVFLAHDFLSVESLIGIGGVLALAEE